VIIRKKGLKKMRKSTEPHLGIISVGAQTMESLETQKKGVNASMYHSPYGEPLRKIMSKSFENFAKQE